MGFPAVYVVVDHGAIERLAGWHLPADDRLLCTALDSMGVPDGPARPYRIVSYSMGALWIDSLLAGGPGYALTRILSIDRESTLGGGYASVLVDVRRRRLLLHYTPAVLTERGDLGSEVGYRLALLSLLRRIWEGWQVDWAWRGDRDLAEHVGLAEDLRRTHLYRPELWSGVWPHHSVVMVRTGAEMRFWSAGFSAADVFLTGPSLVDGVGEGVVIPELTTMPIGGVYLDPSRREVDWWTVGTTEGWDWSAAAAERWPGWQAQFLHDDFRRFFARWAPDTRLPVHSGLALAALRRRLTSPAAEHRYGTDRWELLQVALAEMQARPSEWGYE